MTEYIISQIKRPIIQVWRKNGIKNSATKTIEANRHTNLTVAVLGIIATAVSLIDSFGGAVRKLSNERSSIPIMEKVWHRVA